MYFGKQQVVGRCHSMCLINNHPEKLTPLEQLHKSLCQNWKCSSGSQTQAEQRAAGSAAPGAQHAAPDSLLDAWDHTGRLASGASYGRYACRGGKWASLTDRSLTCLLASSSWLGNRTTSRKQKHRCERSSSWQCGKAQMTESCPSGLSGNQMPKYSVSLASSHL